jgi:DNA-binding GntR family transcriptional regulator
MTESGNRVVTKREYAYMELRDLIVTGELPPGMRLSLRPLADRLGLSVMPIRDALRALELEGLVEMSDHRGAYVARISKAEVLDCVSLRMWLEVHAVMESAQLGDATSLRASKEALAEGRKAIKKKDGQAFTAANRRFHQAIESPVSDICSSMINDLWNRLWQVRRQYSLFLLLPERMQQAQDEHEQIHAAVEAGDVRLAKETAEHHRLATLDAWRVALDSTGDWISSDQADRPD